MKPEPASLFYQMACMRYFEEAIASLWRHGLISGEMHLGIGEEAIVAGVVAHLVEGDALALDHRSTPPLVARGVDMRSIVLELLGSEGGLCRGRGGHMHLFAPAHLAASSGIVGAAAPLACGFALASEHLRPGRIAVAFFGEGAMNQGMVMEALNLAVVWKLPVIFVCKDDGLAITTRSTRVTGGSLVDRARSIGLPASRVDGDDVVAVWRAAAAAVRRARRGGGPAFILARCRHPEGHFLGDPFLRVLRQPRRQLRDLAGPLVAASVRWPGASWLLRLAGLAGIVATIVDVAVREHVPHRGPLSRARRLLPGGAAARLEALARAKVDEVVAGALDFVREEQRG